MLAAILALGGLGVIFGAGLAWAARKLSVAADPRLEEISAKLPGVNCGACGLAGCAGFAEALIKGACSVERCAVTQEKARQEIAAILGVQAKVKVKKSAVLHCHGSSRRVKDRFIYEGIKDCVAANLVMGGPKACVYGCIGYGSCARVCPFGAITMNDEDLPVVDEDRCNACGKCAAICPKKLYSLVPAGKDYAVRCKSLDTAKKVMEVCSAGCIACGKCEKACGFDAIRIIGNLAEIDYDKCTSCGECVKACPTKAIQTFSKERIYDYAD